MSPEDAAMEMEALGHDFYMFHNSKTNLVSVIYIRQDGDYGMLEPAK
jgi:putative sigma-54 modulation protein